LTLEERWIYSAHVSITRCAILELQDLETKIDELINLCDELEKKQTIMMADRETWHQERSRLLEKNELAKSKVEAMILRLKALEQE
jgi:cell division protein ZapB